MADFIKKSADTLNARFKHNLNASILCINAGAFSALSMPPYNFWGVLFLTLPILYGCVWKSGSVWQAGLRGWLFGFGYFVFGLYWIGNALLVEGNTYKWAWPLAVCALPAALSFYTAFACAASKKILKFENGLSLFAFAFIFTGFEWLRGTLFTGFPWNLFGYTWSENLNVIQVLSAVNVYGLTVLTIIWALIPVCCFLKNRNHKVTAALLIVLSFIGNFLYGSHTLNQPESLADVTNAVLVQPSIKQSEKWQGDKMMGHFLDQIELSLNTQDAKGPTIIVWAETALSYRLFEIPSVQDEIRRMLNGYDYGSVLLTGMLLYDRQNENYSNALVMIDQNGRVHNIYKKSHLVPFGEYIPFQEWIPLKPVVQFQGFEKGNGPQSFKLPDGTQYSALVCYEIIFPGKTLPKQDAEKPDFVVNVTNDAWYGTSAGPYQHLIHAQYRAVENRIPVLRVANTGISAYISDRGEIIHKTQLFEKNNLQIQIRK